MVWKSTDLVAVQHIQQLWASQSPVTRQNRVRSWISARLQSTSIPGRASSGNAAKGVLIKLSFGLGIIPVMLVTGAGLSLATIGIRRKLIRVAAVSVVTSIGES